MKDFKHFGVKRRFFPEHNYNALWCNLKTVRLGEGKAAPLPPAESEFYDVGINTKCNAECPFCYVSATGKGVNYPNICDTWKKWMDTFWEKQEQRVLTTNKPFQIAIGSTGEPTIHPEFCDFLKTVYESGVVPNYTTNGIILSKQTPLAEAILEATRKYVGGVAVSFGNEALREQARQAVVNLINNGNTNVNIHHIISDKESVDEFLAEWLRFEDKVLYHVLLPLMPAGRSDSGIEEGVWEYLEEMIQKHNIKNVAFGAHFIKYLRNSKIKTWLYDEESFSKNIILTPNKVQITPSSFDLNPIQIIDL
jgi:MoaA/NifB/PqqE/SkfB family radical SAM enzyme